MSLEVDIAHRLGPLELQIRFEAPAGITALFGRSGSGKTTVINAVSGLLTPARGRILSDGEVMFDSAAGINRPVHRRRIGLVFQDARLFPHLDVKRNLTYGQRFAAHGETGPSLDEVCQLLGIGHLLGRQPGTLSGGEKQRVAIGRALLSRPRMLLMDEPLAALDGPRKEEILPYLESLRDQLGLPILYVSHSVPEIARLATSVVVLDNGRTVHTGSAEDVLSDPSMARLFGLRETGAVLPATVTTHHGDGLTELGISGGRLFLPQMEQPPGSQTRVRILAHDVMLATSEPTDLSALNILKGTVIAVRSGQGPGAIVQLQCGSDRMLARITQRSALALDLRPGRKVHAVVKSVSIARTDVGTG